MRTVQPHSILGKATQIYCKKACVSSASAKRKRSASAAAQSGTVSRSQSVSQEESIESKAKRTQKQSQKQTAITRIVEKDGEKRTTEHEVSSMTSASVSYAMSVKFQTLETETHTLLQSSPIALISGDAAISSRVRLIEEKKRAFYSKHQLSDDWIPEQQNPNCPILQNAFLPPGDMDHLASLEQAGGENFVCEPLVTVPFGCVMGTMHFPATFWFKPTLPEFWKFRAELNALIVHKLFWNAKHDCVDPDLNVTLISHINSQVQPWVAAAEKEAPPDFSPYHDFEVVFEDPICHKKMQLWLRRLPLEFIRFFPGDKNQSLAKELLQSALTHEKQFLQYQAKVDDINRKSLQTQVVPPTIARILKEDEEALSTRT